MKKSTLGIIVAIVAVLAVAGIILTKKPSNESNMSGGMGQMPPDKRMDMPNNKSTVTDLTGQTEVSMEIKDFEFTMPNIKIKKGTKVTWTNQDSAKHNAYSDDANGPKGKLLAKGESYSFVFDIVGTVNYYCQPHPYMKGIVSVVE